MTVTLVNTKSPEPPIVLHRLPATIGRQPRAEVKLDDRSVSHFQCVLVADDGDLTVLDLGSLAGTYVNGARVALRQLQPGDRLTLGALEFLVNYDPAA